MRPILAAWDLIGLRLLPNGWQEEVGHLVKRRGVNTMLDGRSSTSREPVGVDPMRVVVVGGKAISEDLPWLLTLYKEQLRSCAAQYFGAPLQEALDLESAVNVNCLEGNDARYERHVDTNPCTGLLFVNSLTAEHGGELVFEMRSEQVRIRPTAGVFLAFDAREIVHYVEPLRGAASRISIPMNYYTAETEQVRPPDLNRYLYESKE